MTTILVVDDLPDFRAMLKRRYEPKGIRVLEASDGVEGFEVFQAERRQINLVITDMRMPRMSGVELVRVIRALDPIVPILGVTAYGNSQEQVEILASGAYYFLEKPLPSLTSVDKLVMNAIQRHKSESSERLSSRLVRGYILRHSEASLAGAPIEIAIQQIDTPGPSGDMAEAALCSAGEVLFYIADASGHSDMVPSFMACLASMILHRSQYPTQLDPGTVLARVDEGMKHLREHGALSDHLYLTFFLGRIDWGQRVLRYVNAGHPSPILFRQGDSGWECTELLATARPVGMDVPFTAEVKTIPIAPGDLLFLYTDGASEQLGGGPGTEGRELFKSLVHSCLPGSATEVVERVKEELISRVGGADKFEDDTTLMALRIPPVAEASPPSSSTNP